MTLNAPDDPPAPPAAADDTDGDAFVDRDMDESSDVVGFRNRLSLLLEVELVVDDADDDADEFEFDDENVDFGCVETYTRYSDRSSLSPFPLIRLGLNSIDDGPDNPVWTENTETINNVKRKVSTDPKIATTRVLFDTQWKEQEPNGRAWWWKGCYSLSGQVLYSIVVDGTAFVNRKMKWLLLLQVLLLVMFSIMMRCLYMI